MRFINSSFHWVPSTLITFPGARICSSGKTSSLPGRRIYVPVFDCTGECHMFEFLFRTMVNFKAYTSCCQQQRIKRSRTVLEKNRYPLLQQDLQVSDLLSYMLSGLSTVSPRSSSRVLPQSLLDPCLSVYVHCPQPSLSTKDVNDPVLSDSCHIDLELCWH